MSWHMTGNGLSTSSGASATTQEADEAARTLPAQVSAEELTAWGDRHGINRDELMSRMGGSP